MCLVLLESALAVIRHAPLAWKVDSVLRLARRLYSSERDVIHYDPACAQHDQEVATPYARELGI